MGSKAFESPLISHVRMRALYRALAEVRSLARAHRGVEACLVAPSIDLCDGDLISDAGGKTDETLLAHIRAVGRRPTAEAIKASGFEALRKRLITALPDQFPGSAADRLIYAAGAAMALSAAGSHSIMLAYVRKDELNLKDWRRVLAVLGQPRLPLILILLPGACEVESLAKKVGVPVIPVDAGDAVALYRVAQESIVRARAGGGAAVIEAIDCKTDAIKLLGSQLVQKRICTPAWVDRVPAHLASLLAAR